MAITTMLFYRVVRDRWGWPVPKAFAVIIPLFLVDLAFFTANVPKIPAGGWLPLAVGLGLVIQMTTWRRGRAIVARVLQRGQHRTAEVVADAAATNGVSRVPGTAVYLFKDPDLAPPALISNLRHNHVLHETTIVLAVVTADVPHIDSEARVAVHAIGSSVHQVVLTFGYMDTHDVICELRRVRLDGVPLDVDAATFFLGRETVASIPEGEMPRWREELYIVLHRGAESAARFYRLPSQQVFEVGTQVEI
jgi:KUP system potassium uptake protein